MSEDTGTEMIIGHLKANVLSKEYVLRSNWTKYCRGKRGSDYRKQRKRSRERK